MPKSKRNKIVHLTKTVSKGRKGKAKSIDLVQSLCDQFKTIYVFSWENLRTNLIKDLRNELKDDSRIFMGKNNVVRIAFGASKNQAYLPGLDELSRVIRGNVGLLFTNRDAKQVEQVIEKFVQDDFARAGSTAPKTIELPPGPITSLPGSMYEELKRLHFPITLDKGVLVIDEKFALCSKGEVLTPEQAQSLKLFNKKLATFKLRLTHRYRQGEIVQLNQMDIDETPDVDGY